MKNTLAEKQNSKCHNVQRKMKYLG